MSRITDENDPLSKEIAEANAFKPNLAVEVHKNAGGGDGLKSTGKQTSMLQSRWNLPKQLKQK